MKQERAKRILRLLGWGTSQAAREFNRVTGKSYSRQHVNAQLNGTRGVSESLALFLRLRIRISQLERRAWPAATRR
jgi:hypothetical protein